MREEMGRGGAGVNEKGEGVERKKKKGFQPGVIFDSYRKFIPEIIITRNDRHRPNFIPSPENPTNNYTVNLRSGEKELKTFLH